MSLRKELPPCGRSPVWRIATVRSARGGHCSGVESELTGFVLMGHKLQSAAAAGRRIRFLITEPLPISRRLLSHAPKSAPTNPTDPPTRPVKIVVIAQGYGALAPCRDVLLFGDRRAAALLFACPGRFHAARGHRKAPRPARR